MVTVDDEILDLRCRGPEAVERLVGRHAERLYAAVHRISGDPELALDAAQEALLRLVARPPRDTADGQLYGWLLAVALNWLRSQWRARRRRVAREAAIAVARRGPDGATALRNAIVREALAALDDRDLALVTLVRLDGQSYAEAGALLGLTLDQVKKRMGRALAELARHLEDGR